MFSRLKFRTLVRPRCIDIPVTACSAFRVVQACHFGSVIRKTPSPNGQGRNFFRSRERKYPFPELCCE